MSQRELEARRLRLLAWSGLPLIAIARVALEAAPMDSSTQTLLADLLTYLLPIALAALAAGVLAVRVAKGVERRFWGLLSVACLSVLVSECFWTWYVINVDAVGPSLRHPMQVFALVSAVCFSLLAGTMTSAADRSLAYRLRLYLDVLAVMAVVYPVVYLRWTLTLFADFDEQVFLAGRSALWPVFGLLMLVIIFAVMGGYKAGRWRAWERLTVAGIAIISMGLISNPAWYSQALAAGDTSVGWYGAVLGAGLYLFVIGAVYRFTSDGVEAFADSWPLEVPSVGRLSWSYPLVLSAALPLLGWLAFTLTASGTEGPVLSAAIVLALALAARSWLLAIEIAEHRVAALTDSVTGLYNARYLDERLQQLAEESRRPGHPLALLVLRFDDFARVDALHGRVVGDRLLAAVADAVRTIPKAGAEAFRSRSDEFAVAMPSSSVEEAAATAHALLRRMEREDLPAAIPASLSIGIAMFPAVTDNAGDLLTRARVAYEAASRSRSGRVSFFSPELTAAQAESSPVLVPIRRLSTAVRSLADAADERDPLTAGHSRRVAELAEELARALELPDDQIEAVRWAASVHDVGKLGVGKSALAASKPQSEADRVDLERHPVLGARILRALGLTEISEAVLHHHELWNGSGYPQGLAGDAIPLEARVISICDVYDAMISGRAGWQKLEPEVASARILALAGRSFDPDVAEAFVERVIPVGSVIVEPQPA